MIARLLHELIFAQGDRTPGDPALVHGETLLNYADLAALIERVAHGLVRLHLRRSDRVAVYLPKQIETVAAIFGASRAGCVTVPINPSLKSQQVTHILTDSDARVLVTSTGRLETLLADLGSCPDLRWVVTVDDAMPEADAAESAHFQRLSWIDLSEERGSKLPRLTETDIAGILYTSGSTGRPKGVVLTHRNLVAGAQSVVEYLGNGPHDRILSVLPLSFDAGLSQLTTGFLSGAQVVLLDYLLPRDVVRTCEQHQITGVTGVPPLWMQLAELDWPVEVASHMRYFANTGGKMPHETLKILRGHFLNAKPYLMYGLTEAFRSTYLPPGEVDRRPDSIGKAIPNAEIIVVREDGSPCTPGEPGELVHRGPLVSLGYWKDRERTDQRFRPAPGQPSGLPYPELAVWSGDTVTMDEDGFLYFVGRRDDMIKTSGYRVSPTEVEEVAYDSGMVVECAAIGIPHPRLGEGIVLVAKPRSEPATQPLLDCLRQALPVYMVPACIQWMNGLPRGANGKIARQVLKEDLLDIFSKMKA